MLKFSFSLLALMLISAGCSSTQLLREKDYAPSLKDFARGNADDALRNFPSKEEGGFVTTVEKSWLSLWSTAYVPESKEKQELAALEKQRSTFDERRYISITREAMTFLSQESEEGYVPAEHEVVVLHLIAAMKFMKMKNWSEAEVEARRAGFYLQTPFNQDLENWDDPGLRVWLAAIWNALGNWEAAQVDLRRAAKLSSDKRLTTIASGAQPDALTIYMSGVAPQLRWSDSSSTPEFVHSQTTPHPHEGVFSTAPWFERHSRRNTLLRESLLKSNYMAGFLGVKARSQAAWGLSTIGIVTLGAIGVGTGIALLGGGLYLASSLGLQGDAVGYLLIPGAAVTYGAWNVAKHEYRLMSDSIEKDEAESIRNYRTYRFVRFLPATIEIEQGAAIISKAVSNRDVSLEFSRQGHVGRSVFVHDF